MNTNFIDRGRYASRAAGPISIAYASGAAQEPILLPLVSEVAITLSFDFSGGAYVDGTNSSHEDVEAGSAVWKQWDAGAVTATTQAIGKGMTAIRVYRSSGTPRVTVGIVGQP